MKKLLIMALIVIAGYQGWKHYSQDSAKLEPLYEEPYVVVYGRDSCGFTQKTLRELEQAGIPFDYQIVDDQSVANILHSRMEKAGIDTRRYNLPVVDISNNISIRPASAVIINAYETYEAPISH